MNAMHQLDALCESLFSPDAPGAAIGVLMRGGFRYAKGFGLANLDARIPFTPQTPFRVCSITKQFVCLMMRQLESEGKIALDLHPSRYLVALDRFPAALTVRHLCQNRSGLRDYWCAAMLTGANFDSRFTLDQGAELIRALVEPMFAPGTQYSYSNGNWRILEWIIEAVTERTLPDLLAERVFVPLGMRDTGWGSDTGLALNPHSKGYRSIDGEWEEEITRACWSGDAALVSTLDDLLKWEVAMLTAALPSSEALAEAMPHANGEPGSYAYGINAWQQDGRWMHWHGGALRGWRMVHLRFPQDGASIVVMLNRTENPTPFALKIAHCIGVKTTWDEVSPCAAAADTAVNGVYYSASLDLLAEFATQGELPTLDLGGESTPLMWIGDNALANASGFYRIERHGEYLDIRARQFGWRDKFLRVPFRDDRRHLAGLRCHCSELKSTVAFNDTGTVVRIIGANGDAADYAVRPLAKGIVAFDCTRALDELPPGRFTIRIELESRRLVIGCFGARGFVFAVA